MLAWWPHQKHSRHSRKKENQKTPAFCQCRALTMSQGKDGVSAAVSWTKLLFSCYVFFYQYTHRTYCFPLIISEAQIWQNFPPKSETPESKLYAYKWLAFRQLASFQHIMGIAITSPTKISIQPWLLLLWLYYLSKWHFGFKLIDTCSHLQ